MQDLISAAILIATLLGGTLAAEKIHHAVREVALTKAAQGLPSLSRFASGLTGQRNGGRKPFPKPSAHAELTQKENAIEHTR